MEQAFLSVPEDDSKHPNTTPDRIIEPPSLNGCEQNFSVGMTTERSQGRMSAKFKIASKGLEVVYFSVEGDYIAAAHRMHWLMAVYGQIHDGEAAKTQSDARLRVGPSTGIIRATAPQGM